MTTTVTGAGRGVVKYSASRPRSADLGEEDRHVRDATRRSRTPADASRVYQSKRVGHPRGVSVDAKLLRRTAIVAVFRDVAREVLRYCYERRADR
jgi:hypothetical protein